MELKQVAVFASGRGSNFRHIVEKIRTDSVQARVALLITNNPDAGALKIARDYGIPARIFPPVDFPNSNSYNDSILEVLVAKRIEYIVLAGYMRLVGSQIVNKYENRIINIHPALLPAFGGKGMYGHHVHEAVFESGVKFSGATVHIVDTKYDNGPIVLQDVVSIADVKNADEIAEKVLDIEHRIFPEALRLLVEQRLRITGRRVEVLKEQGIAEN